MSAREVIGRAFPDTLEGAHAEIARLRAIERDWLAFAGELDELQDRGKLARLADFIRRINTKSSCMPRNAARILWVMAQRPDKVWPREVLFEQAKQLTTRDYHNDAEDWDPSAKLVDVLLVSARQFLKQIDCEGAIYNVWGQGFVLRADAAKLILKIAGGES
jgi:DNA-binding response OmpR family regulator